MQQRVALASTAWLTTLRRDGSAHVTPVWYVFLEEQFWISSAASNVKVRNLKHDARVTLAIDGSAAAPLIAEGHAAVVAYDAAPPLDRLFAQKYDGWNFRDPVPDGPRALLRVEVTRWFMRGSLRYRRSYPAGVFLAARQLVKPRKIRTIPTTVVKYGPGFAGSRPIRTTSRTTRTMPRIPLTRKRVPRAFGVIL